MGEVYCARDTRLDRIVAVKILSNHIADRAGLRERFDREARTIASLNHPHICTLFDIGRFGDFSHFIRAIPSSWSCMAVLSAGRKALPLLSCGH